MTSFTGPGGFFIAFTSVISAFVSVSKAAKAASSIGIACKSHTSKLNQWGALQNPIQSSLFLHAEMNASLLKS
jgi:hypothetical protein